MKWGEPWTAQERMTVLLIPVFRFLGDKVTRSGSGDKKRKTEKEGQVIQKPMLFEMSSYNLDIEGTVHGVYAGLSQTVHGYYLHNLMEAISIAPCCAWPGNTYRILVK